jgi:2-oxoisovalerate ferredoxin oxidoreductase beta subunit
VRPGGTILYDRTLIAEPPAPAPGVRALGVPFTGIAAALGRPRVKNAVALGALQAATGLFPRATFDAAIERAMRGDCALAEINREAFARGAAAAAAGEGERPSIVA